MGSIVFELKFTDHDPDGRQIIALVAFTITLALYPRALFEGDKRTAIVLLVFAAILPRDYFFKFECRISSNLSQNQAKFNPRSCIIKINLQRSGRGETNFYLVYFGFSHVALYGRDDQNGGRLPRYEPRGA